MDAKGIAAASIADGDLAVQVASQKSLFFREKDSAGAWIDYHDAVRGKLQLVPVGARFTELAFDYGAMQSDGLLPEDALSFAKLMERCNEIEAKTNAATKSAN